MTIHTKFTALILAAATATGALAATSTPAFADHGNVGSLVAGVIIGGALVNGINTANHPVVHYYSQDEYYAPPRQHATYTIPARCELSVDRGRGFERAYFRGCLEHAGFRGLPDRCDFTVYTDHGPRDAIPRWCMEHAGYRFRN
ncbi:MAG: hypothetical protein GC186_16865 [Rhodobacteraceae bacterium]|nr:hypothetical protein [Paracoccaceae bacterium]